MKQKQKKKPVRKFPKTGMQHRPFYLFPYVAVFFIALALLVLGKSFLFPAPEKIADKFADFGGVGNIISQNGDWHPVTDPIYFNNEVVGPPPHLAYAENNKVLSATSGDNKWIDISLTQQKLRAYEGNNLVYDFPISSGLPWTPTVKGTFNIWYKIKYTRMTGGSKEAGNFYDLPNVPFNMFFYGDYAMHGAYWHNNFGHPMSHGCVNIRTPDAEKLFYWTTPTLPSGRSYFRSTPENPGTRVVVHD